MQTLVQSDLEMEQLGENFSKNIKPNQIIFCEGEIGSGKTTFLRGLMRGLGYKGFVVSPTYTIFEFYTTSKFNILHVDLYRIKDLKDFYHLGLQDYFSESTIILIEWPENFYQVLPKPSWHCQFHVNPNKGPHTRIVTIKKV